MKLHEIVHILEATVLTKSHDLTKDFKRVGASDLMSDILAGLSEGGILITGLATLQVVKTAMIAGITAVVFVRNKKPTQDVIDLAESESIPLLTSPLSMFVSCGRLYEKGMTGLNNRR